MKHQLVTQILTCLALALGAPLFVTQPSQAGGAEFFCGTSTDQAGKPVPATIGRTPSKKEIVLIRWVDNTYFPPPYTPQQRCQVVSQRFQQLADNGKLRSINKGILNDQPVVCAAINKSDFCTEATLLFTLKRGSDPDMAVRRLMDLRDGASRTGPLNEAGCKEDCAGNVLVDLSEILELAPDRRNPRPSSPSNVSPKPNDDTLW